MQRMEEQLEIVLNGKWAISGWGRLEACEFLHCEAGSFFICKSTTTEEVHCPGEKALSGGAPQLAKPGTFQHQEIIVESYSFLRRIGIPRSQLTCCLGSYVLARHTDSRIFIETAKTCLVFGPLPSAVHPHDSLGENINVS